MRTRFLFLLLLLGSSLPGRAQRTAAVSQAVVQPPQPEPCFLAPAPAAESYRFRLDSLLTALNKAQVPTGILYDRVFPLARLDGFGQAVADTSRFEHFLQANQELWYAAYTCTGLRSPTDVRILAAGQQKAGLVPIGLLHYRFNLLDTLAVQNGLFSQPGGEGGALYDVAGRTQSPYLTRETLVAAVLVESVPAGTVQFKLPTFLRFDNTGNAVQSLTLEFNDGTPPATLLPGGAGAYKLYTTGGEYIIQLTAHFADGSSKATFTRLLITGQTTFARNVDRDTFPTLNTCNSTSDERIPLTASIPYTDYEGNTYAGYGAVTTYYAHCNNRQLTKPVIMLDGIEFGGANQRVGIDIYSDFLNYRDQGAPKRLGEELRAVGNDILVLDFPDANGAEYIQRNAFVLIQLIQNVNADLRSRSSMPEQLTVIGPSMGGLVSRYALAYMEKKFNDANDPATYHRPEWNHNTRLWISFDSPQLGANVPIGDQQWLAYYALIVEVEAALNNLKDVDTPASKEMLVHHIRSTSQYVAGAPDFRDRFQNELNDLGMPAQLRRISVVNGSLAGIRQDWLTSARKANGCDQAFSFEAKTGAVRLFYIKYLTYTPPMPTSLSSSEVHFSADYGQSCLTFSGRALARPYITRYTIGRPSSVSYDVAPGSWRETQATIAAEGTSTNARIDGFFQNVFLGGFLSRPSQTATFYNVIGKHCFIPTVSALALTNPNRDLGQNLSGTNLVCSGETPFDSYFAPTQNEEHITVTAANAAYLKMEIGNQTPTPVFTAAPEALCPGGGPAATFTVEPECSRQNAAGQPLFPVVYDWTISGPAEFVGIPNSQTLFGAGNSQNVVGTAASGTVTLTVVARRAGAAASAPLVRILSVTRGELAFFGIPDQRAAATAQPVAKTADASPQFGCSPITVYITPVGLSVALPYTVTKTTFRPSGQVLARTSFSVTNQLFSVSIRDSTELVLTGTSLCDGQPVTSDVLPYEAVVCRTNTPEQPAAYPNPADAVLTLTAPNATAAPGPRTAALYNAQGREVRRTRPHEAQLTTADLPTGLYYLVVEQAGHVTRSQIRVQH